MFANKFSIYKVRNLEFIHDMKCEVLLTKQCAVIYKGY